MGSWTHKPEKRLANKRTRQALAQQLPEKLEDDYPIEEFMADICTDESPCPWCLARERREAQG